MVEPEIEPETNFEQDNLELEELAEQLEDEGFDPEEIEEALYDPAPRRHRRHRRRMRRAYDPTPRRHRRHRRARHYDPAPRRGRRRGRRGGRRAMRSYAQRTRRPKGMLGKFRKYVLPAATLGSFYLSYAANAKARGMTIGAALKADLQNWDANKVWAKIQASPAPAVGTIGIPIAKRVIPGLRSGTTGIVVDAVQGILTGQFITQVIDEPAPLRTAARAQEVKTQRTTSTMPVGLNPYA